MKIMDVQQAKAMSLSAGPPRPPARPVSAALRQELRRLLVEGGAPHLSTLPE